MRCLSLVKDGVIRGQRLLVALVHLRLSIESGIYSMAAFNRVNTVLGWDQSRAYCMKLYIIFVSQLIRILITSFPFYYHPFFESHC